VDWITDAIAIGNYLESQDVELLRRESIQSVLCLDGTLEGRLPGDMGLREIECHRLEDGPGNDPRLFRLALAALGRLVEQAPPVLVQCHAGRSRSAIVVAGHLMRSLGIEPENGLALVAARREIVVTAGLEQLLEKLD
jgi:Dual specificity phosphatase, catalytic domain